jgi:hypothetical protein
MDNKKNYRNPVTFKVIEKQAYKLSEMAYLEACQPDKLKNEVLVSYCFKESKRLTNRLINAGYWKKS